MTIPKLRAAHRLLALWLVLPFSLMSFTGCLLQLKPWISFIQPQSQVSAAGALQTSVDLVTLPALLSAAALIPEAKVSAWSDIQSIDVRPKLGVARMRTKNDFELQVDLSNGKVLSAAPRYTSFLISLHEGVYFGKFVHNALFVPASVFLLILNITGICLLSRHYLRGNI